MYFNKFVLVHPSQSEHIAKQPCMGKENCEEMHLS